MIHIHNKEKEYQYSILTCRNCGHKNNMFLTDEEYDADYGITCEGCANQYSISEYDYEPVEN